jgi:hypothetical protein
MAPAVPAGKARLSQMLAGLPSMFGAVSPLRWGDPEYVAKLFGESVESLEMSRRRTELAGFTNETELRDFLRAHHPVAVALYREAAEDPEAVAMLDDSLLGVIKLSYARSDGETGSFVQEAVLVVAHTRGVTLAS